jgi:pilus assembly protein CpaF
MEGSIITTQDLFVFERAGVDENNRVVGTFRPTGIRPKFTERLEACGIRFSVDAFSGDSRTGGRR